MGNFKSELSNYQNVPRELVFDKTLSDRARFVYVFMACKPDGWDFFLEPMSKDIGYSVDTLRKYLNELVASGWLVKGEQSNEYGIFGAVEYTLKATKFTDTENFRYGKNTAQEDIDNISLPNTGITINKEINKKEYKEKFAEFVFLYKTLTGRKPRSVDTEFSDFEKRHKDWKEVIDILPIAIRNETNARNLAKQQGRFFPEPKMLQTWLGKQRAWEMYATLDEKEQKQVSSQRDELLLQRFYQILGDEEARIYGIDVYQWQMMTDKQREYHRNQPAKRERLLAWIKEHDG